MFEVDLVMTFVVRRISFVWTIRWLETEFGGVSYDIFSFEARAVLVAIVHRRIAYFKSRYLHFLVVV